MKRRGFLSLLGGAAVAGPGMVKQAAGSVGINAMAIPSLGMDYGMEAPYGSSAGIGGNSEYDHTQWLRERIGELVGISDADRRERIAMTHVSVLDPDLAVNRSFSLAFKIQEQKRRNFDRYRAREHKDLTRQLAEHLKRQF